MKKLLLVLSILLLTSTAFGADLETGETAQAYEANYGRSVTPGTCELLTIWHTGTSTTNNGFGVSRSTIVLYENGIPITATRFQSAANVTYTNKDVSQVVSAINSDTSGYFKAALGRDATPNTTTAYFQPANVRIGIADNEVDAVDDGDVVTEDADRSLTLRAGFQGDDQTTLRLKLFSEHFEGTGDHEIRVWDDDECVYRRTYEGVNAYNSASPLTVTFTDYGSKGLSAHKGKSLVVTSDWQVDVSVSDERDANLSIVVGHWKE